MATEAKRRRTKTAASRAAREEGAIVARRRSCCCCCCCCDVVDLISFYSDGNSEWPQRRVFCSSPIAFQGTELLLLQFRTVVRQRRGEEKELPRSRFYFFSETETVKKKKKNSHSTEKKNSSFRFSIKKNNGAQPSDAEREAGVLSPRPPLAVRVGALVVKAGGKARARKRGRFFSSFFPLSHADGRNAAPSLSPSGEAFSSLISCSEKCLALIAHSALKRERKRDRRGDEKDV